MAALWKSILGQYGQSVTLLRGEERAQVRAFFQPVDEKAPGTTPTPLGKAPAGKYLYLGPAEEDMEDVEELGWEGRLFRVLRHREYRIGDETVYRWALCEEADG